MFLFCINIVQLSLPFEHQELRFIETKQSKLDMKLSMNNNFVLFISQ